MKKFFILILSFGLFVSYTYADYLPPVYSVTCPDYNHSIVAISDSVYGTPYDLIGLNNFNNVCTNGILTGVLNVDYFYYTVGTNVDGYQHLVYKEAKAGGGFDYYYIIVNMNIGVGTIYEGDQANFECFPGICTPSTPEISLSGGLFGDMEGLTTNGINGATDLGNGTTGIIVYSIIGIIFLLIGFGLYFDIIGSVRKFKSKN